MGISIYWAPPRERERERGRDSAWYVRVHVLREPTGPQDVRS